jgi:hypothetical protein
MSSLREAWRAVSRERMVESEERERERERDRDRRDSLCRA